MSTSNTACVTLSHARGAKPMASMQGTATCCYKHAMAGCLPIMGAAACACVGCIQSLREPILLVHEVAFALQHLVVTVSVSGRAETNKAAWLDS